MKKLFIILISVSFNLLTIAQVILPTTGTIWAKGKSSDIQWTQSNYTTNIKIELERFSNVVKTISSSTANDGSFSYSVPTDLTSANNYMVKVSGISGQPFNKSEYFSIQDPAPTPPTVTTGSTANLAASSTNLRGTVNPNGASLTTWYFQYGKTTNYGNETYHDNFSETSTQSVEGYASNLTPLTLYHYRLVAINSAGTTYGSDKTFTTTSANPGVTTNAATNISSTSSQLNGTVNPHGYSTSTYFQYGTSTNYGLQTATKNVGSGTSSTVTNSSVIDLTPGTTYHYRIVATSYGGNSFGNDVTFTTEPALTGNLALTILNVPGGSTLLPNSEGRVRLFNSSGTQVGAELNTDANGKVTFSNVPVGTGYYYEVYHDPIEPPTPFNREYWGKRTELEIKAGGVTESFTRDQPYGGEIHIFNGATEITAGQTVQAGTPLTIKRTIHNPSNTQQSARGVVLFDRDKAGSFDITARGAALILVPAKGSAVQEISFTPSEAGSYYMAGGADISSSITPNYMDGGKWGIDPIFKVSGSFIETRLEHKDFDGITPPLPWNFSGLQGTLIRFNAKLFEIFPDIPPTFIQLKSKPIRFEIKINGTWQKIDEDGITTTSQTTSSSGIGENYYLIPDNLNPTTYDIRALFDEDSEYASCILNGKLTVKEPIDELVSIPTNDLGYTGEKIALILVHGNGVDEEEDQTEDRWNTLIDFITQSGNLEFFKEFEVYRWHHTTQIPIGFNGTTGNAKRLRNDINVTIPDKKIIFVAHSQGGLICRSYMNYGNQGNNVLGLITLGTPHHGSPGVPDWSAIMWARKVGTGALTGGNFFNDLFISQGSKGPISSIHDISAFTYDRIGTLNLVWDNEDGAIIYKKNESFSVASFSSLDGFVELSINDLNTNENPLISDRTILYPQVLKTKFGCLKELNDAEKNKTKIITYGCYDDNLNDNPNFGEVNSLWNFFSDHDKLKVATRFLSDFGEIRSSSINFYANDGLVPLQSALFLDISGGTTFFGNNSGTVYYNNNIELKKQVKLQRTFSKSADGIGDHLDLLDTKSGAYWNKLAIDIHSFIPIQDNVSPTVSSNTANPEWFFTNSILNIDFADNAALNNVWYQIDSKDVSNWHNLTSDGTTILPGSQNNTGTSLTTDWKISNTDWNNLSNGMHYLYFKVTDDAGNTYITPDQASAFAFGKDISEPLVQFSAPSENQILLNADLTASWTISDGEGSGVKKVYFALDQNAVFIVNDAPYASHQFSDLSNGNHTIYLKATDNAGNESDIKELHFSVHVPTELVRTSGNSQSGIISTTLGRSFTATVKDANGNGVPGIPVSFAIQSVPAGAAGQTLSNTTTTTDPNGQAKSKLTLGNKVGTYQISATSDGLSGSPVVFTATATEALQKLISTNPDLSFDFGNVVINGTADKTVTISNDGSAVVHVSNLVLSENTQFSMISSSGNSFDIPVGGEVEVTIKFNPTSEGQKTATLNISNDSENATVKTISFTGFGNREPIANAGTDQTVTEGDFVILDGSASSDADENNLTYKWTAPEGITLSSTTVAKPTFTAPEVTTDTEYKFTVVVNDGTVDSKGDEVIVTVQNVDLNNGLVAYYPFNGDAKDMSGNGYDGNAIGATLTNDRNWNSNSAYSFNGIDNVITLPSGSNVQGNYPRSITSWYKLPETIENSGYCIYKGGRNGTGQDFTLFLNKRSETTYSLHLRRYFDDIWSVEINLEPNSWCFFAVTYNGTTNDGISLYKDGKLLELAGKGNGSTFNTPSVIPQIGDFVDQFSNHYFAKGVLDEIRIYDRELNSSEIDALYKLESTSNRTPVAAAGANQTVNEGETVTLDGSASSDPDNNTLTYNWTAPSEITLSSNTVAKPTFTAPEVTTDTVYKFTLVVNDGMVDSSGDEVIITVKNSDLIDGLVAWYPFNGNANDESGNLNHGTVNGASLTTDRFGNADKAYHFNSSERDYISLPKNVINSNIDDFTVSAWYYDNSSFTKWEVSAIIHVGNLSEYGLVTLNNNGIFQVKLKQDSQWYAANDQKARKNIWTHAVGIYEKGKQVKLFINGELVGQTPVPNDSLFTINNLYPAIGAAIASWNQWQFWQGDIDDIKIFNHSLTDKEVFTLYREEVNPIVFTTNISVLSINGQTSISTEAGTLQMKATILPENATSQKVKWSVVNGTGKAEITEDGLLKAIVNGDVTAVASAMDGTGIKDSIAITINGQEHSVYDLNIIRNGNFDLVMTNGVPTYWGGWIDSGYGDLQQSVDGVAVLNNTNIHSTENWHYQFGQSNITALPNVPYVVSFVAWAENDRNIYFTFQDIAANNYNRYGSSSDPEAINGRSEWSFVITTEPKRYTFNVTFDQIKANTNQGIFFMISQAMGTVYLDDIWLVSEEDLLSTGCPQHFHPLWEGTLGQDHMNINALDAKYDGLDLEPGDEIGIFDGNLCVGYGKVSKTIDQQNILTIRVSRNDGSGNGYTIGHNISYVVWDCSAGLEIAVTDVQCFNNQSSPLSCLPFEAGATAYVKLSVVSDICQTLEFKTGWNIFSVPNSPKPAEIETVFQSMMENNSLVKMQDEEGNSVENWGIFGGWKNGIGVVTPTEGYKIKVSTNYTHEVCGKPVKYPYAISLQSGWNIMGYPQTETYNGIAVLQQLIDRGKLVKVQEEAGNSIEDWGIFGGWKNSIGDFVPGKGYKIKVNANDELLIYSSYPKSSAILPELVTTIHFHPEFEGNGIDHMNINLVGLPVNVLHAGDELAIFDGVTCVGAITILPHHLQSQTASISVSARDNQGMPGFGEGNPITLKLWNSKQNREFILEPEIVKGTSSFAKHETTIASLEKYATTGLEGLPGYGNTEINCYPNPFSDKVTIEIKLAKDSEVQVEVLNQLGQRVKMITSKQLLSGGLHKLEWDGKVAGNQAVSHGVYHLKVNVEGNNIHKRIVYSK